MIRIHRSTAMRVFTIIEQLDYLLSTKIGMTLNCDVVQELDTTII